MILNYIYLLTGEELEDVGLFERAAGLIALIAVYNVLIPRSGPSRLGK